MYNDELHLPLNQRTMPTFEEFLQDKELLAMYPEVLVNSAWLEDEESTKHVERMTLWDCYVSTVDFVWGPEASAKLKDTKEGLIHEYISDKLNLIGHTLDNLGNDVYERSQINLEALETMANVMRALADELDVKIAEQKVIDQDAQN